MTVPNVVLPAVVTVILADPAGVFGAPESARESPSAFVTRTVEPVPAETVPPDVRIANTVQQRPATVVTLVVMLFVPDAKFVVDASGWLLCLAPVCETACPAIAMEADALTTTLCAPVAGPTSSKR